MLSEQQLVILRSEPAANRVAKAISLAGVTQKVLAEAVNLTQPYVSDVARGRYQTITVENARKFARFFGCGIEDLFPAPDEEPPRSPSETVQHIKP
ncbi:MAG: helix-turn-helix transcriptional regulator [Acidobacteria bacterium]|nr:helix-turn-helix transcriptional regulator [Acidobacteriota bacterium]